MKTLKTLLGGVLLSSAFASSALADCSFELFSISSTKETKIIDFVEQLSDECEYSIIVNDTETQKHLDKRLNKTHLKNLTIDEVFKIVLTNNNLTYKLENNILKISYLTTKVFEIDYILSARKSTGNTDVTLSTSSGEEGASDTGGAGINIESSDEVKFWETLDKEIQSILNRPHDNYKADEPVVNKNAGLITATATVAQLTRLEEYLKRLQDKVQLQVLIDVQLLTVEINEGHHTGIDWEQLYALQNVNITASYNKNFPNGSGSGFMTAGVNIELKDVIKFLQTQGDVNSISNPKILTLNNQPALITVGKEYFYKLVSSSQGTGDGAIATQDEEIKSVFAGVLLDITPEISTDGDITLKINPSLSTAETTQDTNMPPNLNKQQLSAVITVKDGKRVILGGLIQTIIDEGGNKIPLLGDIPLVGLLFKHEKKSKRVKELVVIIEPHIVKKDNGTLSLSDLGYEGFDDSVVSEKGRTTKLQNTTIDK